MANKPFISMTWETSSFPCIRTFRHILQKTKQTTCLSKLSFYSALWKQRLATNQNKNLQWNINLIWVYQSTWVCLRGLGWSVWRERETETLYIFAEKHTYSTCAHTHALKSRSNLIKSYRITARLPSSRTHWYQTHRESETPQTKLLHLWQCMLLHFLFKYDISYLYHNVLVVRCLKPCQLPWIF